MSAISLLRALPLRTIVGVLVIGYFVFLYVTEVGDNRFVLMVIFLAVLGTWRSHLQWRRMRRQRGMELLSD
ncbi:MAG TPA: hypothetical protein VF190_03815 [Rhodothermales bacterium]